MTHEIRLAGPWDCLSDPDDEWHRCILPFIVPEKSTVGKAVVIRRRFHKPSGLNSKTRLFLVVDGVPGLERIQLNHTHIDVAKCVESKSEFEVSNQLDLVNVVSIPLSGPGAQIESVTLRIEDSSQATDTKSAGPDKD